MTAIDVDADQVIAGTVQRFEAGHAGAGGNDNQIV
jgi:hypothetical protein